MPASSVQRSGPGASASSGLAGSTLWPRPRGLLRGGVDDPSVERLVRGRADRVAGRRPRPPYSPGSPWPTLRPENAGWPGMTGPFGAVGADGPLAGLPVGGAASAEPDAGRLCSGSRCSCFQVRPRSAPAPTTHTSGPTCTFSGRMKTSFRSAQTSGTRRGALVSTCRMAPCSASGTCGTTWQLRWRVTSAVAVLPELLATPILRAGPQISL